MRLEFVLQTARRIVFFFLLLGPYEITEGELSKQTTQRSFLHFHLFINDLQINAAHYQHALWLLALQWSECSWSREDKERVQMSGNKELRAASHLPLNVNQDELPAW